jgi:uncharacterized RDD family membrane protein YckC
MNKFERILSSVIDFFVISLLSIPFIVVEFILIFNNYTGLMYFNIIAISFVTTAFVCKDVILSVSVGKHILGLRIIVDVNDDQIKPYIYVLRNITYFLWPLELILMLIGNGRRMGDMLLGTRVVSVKNFNVTESKPISFGLKAILFVTIFSIQSIVFISIMLFLERSIPVLKLL